MLMKKAAAQTQSAQREAADLLAQRDAAQKKAREEQEAREAKEREARKARILYELETARKAEEEALRKLQKEKDRLLEGRPDVRWTPPKTKAPSSVQNRTVRQVQETSDKSRVRSFLNTHARQWIEQDPAFPYSRLRRALERIPSIARPSAEKKNEHLPIHSSEDKRLRRNRKLR